MAKGGKLTKLKSVLKKWQSFSKLGRSNSSIAAANHSDEDSSFSKLGRSNSSIAAANHSDEDSSSFDQISGRELFPVYVGKSRRRYLISSEVVDHPVFRELTERSGDDDTIIVGCEVVLFEHLLWMLENADPQPESLDELVEFYAC